MRSTTSAEARAWERVRGNLRVSAGVRLFEQWLKPMVLVPSEEPDTIRLGLPTPFAANWVRNHYAERLVHEFRALLPDVRTVVIETCANTPPVATFAADPVAGDPIAAVPMVAEAALPPMPASPASAVEAVPAVERPVLYPGFRFERFVIDASNRIACNAARAMAEPGAPRFSPLFLHSTTGQGKTHLMHAIGAAFLEARPDARVICLSAERFMFEFVRSLRARDTFAFKALMRSADLLMIDDLQFIAGKDATQEEFFHTVNEIMSAGKRLVISADRCPQSLEGVEDRIVTRLTAGMVAEIRPSDLLLRRAILDARVAECGGAVPEEVLDLLALRITSSIRELEGALNRLVAYAQLTGEAIDVAFAESTLGELLRGGRRRVTIEDIQRAVSNHFELKQLDLVSARRAREVARPRQIAMYLAKRLTTRSLPEIGRKFGGRDHSTVIYAVKRIEELRASDGELDGAVRALMRGLEG